MGVEGFFDGGCKCLTNGLVNNPNTTVLKRTTVMVLVIIIAFPRSLVCPEEVNYDVTEKRLVENFFKTH